MTAAREMAVAALAILSFTAASLAAAADPACCRLFGIDATPILGDDPAICGELRDANDRPDTEALAREDRKHAAECARAAQAAGRSYVYTYRQLVSPDIDVVIQAVSGVDGQHLLLNFGNFRGENQRSAHVCAQLKVLAGGLIEARGCLPSHPLLEQLRAPFPADKR